MNHEQVAGICGCAIGTVKSRVNRARTVLKQKLLGGDERAVAECEHRAQEHGEGAMVIRPLPVGGSDGAL